MARTSNTAAALATSTVIANIVHLSNPVQVALFNEILKGEITLENGRWFANRTKDHHLPFVDAVAIVCPEGGTLGVQFTARKLNYNFNDSNWVGQEATLVRLQEVADRAAGGDKKHAKKEIYGLLEDIKNILKASTYKAPEVVEALVETVESTEAKVEEAA